MEHQRRNTQSGGDEMNTFRLYINNDEEVFLTIAVATAAFSFNSCSKDDALQKDSDKYITISTGIAGMTHVSTGPEGSQSFEEGDVISIYVWTWTDKEGKIIAPGKDERLVDNSHNTLSNSSWIAEPRMLWENMWNKHYFIGVYPAIARGEGLDDDLTRYAYTLKPAEEETSDLLVAVETDGILAGYGTVPLKFTHAMAKVNVNLTFRNQWGVDENDNNVIPEVDSVYLADAAGKATVNLLSKKVTPDEKSRGNQTLPEVAENTRYSSIVIPQEKVNKVTVVIGGKNYTYTHSSYIVFAGGKVTTINLSVGRNVTTLSGVTVDPWEESDAPISGDADLELTKPA